MAVPAIAFAAVVALTSALARRGRPLAATLALPAGWTAFEHLLSRVSPHGTFGSLAYTQMDCLPVIQVAAVLGISGITFLLMLVPSALAVVGLPVAGRDRARIAGMTSALVALVLGYGGWRLLRDDGARPPVTVGLVAADRPEQPVPGETDEGRALVDRYARAAEALGARGARDRRPAGDDRQGHGRRRRGRRAPLREALHERGSDGRPGRGPHRPRATRRTRRWHSRPVRRGSTPSSTCCSRSSPAISRDARSSCWTGRRGAWGSRSARTWTSRISAASMPSVAPRSCWSRPGTSPRTGGSTAAWRCCAASREASRSPVPRAAAA